ncbi:hypothetical protein [Mailhella sp.]
MSQINALPNGPHAANDVGAQAPNRPELSAQARTALDQRITGVVQRFEVLPYQARRINRTQGQQVGYTIGRIVGAVLTLGVSEGIIAIGHKAEKLNAQNLREQAVSRLTTAAYANEAVGRAVQSGEGFPSPAFKSAVREAVAELKHIFGDVLPENAADLPDLPFARELSSAVKASLAQMEEEVSPEQLKALVLGKAVPLVQKEAMQKEMARSFSAAGFRGEPAKLMDEMMRGLPRLQEELSRCGDREAFARVFEAHRKEVDAFTATNKARSDALDHAVESLAARLGLSAADMHMRMPARLEELERELRQIAPGAQTLSELCIETADAFVGKVDAAFTFVDSLGLSPQLAALWKDMVLTAPVLPSADLLNGAFRLAESVDFMGGAPIPFMNAMGNAEDFYLALSNLGQRMEQLASSIVDPDVWRELGPDGQSNLLRFAMPALMDKWPALRQTLAENPGFLAELRHKADDVMKANRGTEAGMALAFKDAVRCANLIDAFGVAFASKAQIAAAVTKPEALPKAYLQALNRAEASVRSRFSGVALPADFMQAYPFSGPKLSNLLREAVENSGEALSPEGFGQMALRLMNRAAADAVARQTIAERLEQADIEGTHAFTHRENVNDAMLVLVKRHPELVEALSGAFGLQAVRSTLDGLDDFAPMLRFFADASRAWAAGERYLYRRMAEATGLPEADVRERLNTAGILRGNAFHYQRGDWLNILKDPAQSLAVLPSSEEMIQLYEGMAERFASRKGALYQSVDGLPGLSEGYRAELKEAVLKGSELKMPSFFERCSRTAQDMYAAPLLRAIEAGEDGGTLLEAVRSLAQQYDSASHVTFTPDILADMGSDETSSIQRYSIGMFMDLNPALRGSLDAERGNALMAQVEEEMTTRIAQELSRAHPESPAYAQAQARYAQAATMIMLLNGMTQGQG